MGSTRLDGLWHLEIDRRLVPPRSRDPPCQTSLPALKMYEYGRISDIYRIAQRTIENSKDPNALNHGTIR